MKTLLLGIFALAAYSVFALPQFEFDQPLITLGYDFECNYSIMPNSYNIANMNMTVPFNSSEDYQCPPTLRLYYEFTNITPLTDPGVDLTTQEQEHADAGFEFHCSYDVEPNPYGIAKSTLSAYFNSSDEYECPPTLVLDLLNFASNYNIEEESIEPQSQTENVTSSEENVGTSGAGPSAGEETLPSENTSGEPETSGETTAEATTAIYWVVGILVAILIVAIILGLRGRK